MKKFLIIALSIGIGYFIGNYVSGYKFSKGLEIVFQNNPDIEESMLKAVKDIESNL